MRKLSRIVIALLMVITMVVLLPMQVLADSQKEYISEVKVFTGSYAEAEKEGYKILTDGNNAIDLNQKAGGGMGSKGEKAVYLGYKTTTESKEAITDLALMNMKGGYSVQDYEALMETQMKSQIIPFVEKFLAAINEYRENYNSDNENNQLRAQYIHDALNKFTDDDCGGAGLGDLLLNETKYEMGDAAYNKLTDAEKNKHADILTIIAQSNGKATLMMESLLTRAADTNEDSWLDRFSTTTYDDLIEETGLAPSKAKKELAKLYDDDAQQLLGMWEQLQESLLEYDDAVAHLEAADDEAAKQALENFSSLDENSSAEDIVDAFNEIDEVGAQSIDDMKDTETIALHEYFDEMEYGDGTLLDFFMQDAADIEADITVLYPLVASLSDGQRAGLDFVTLRQLAVIAIIRGKDYKAADIDALEKLSIYDGVDRAIYEKGGVALTSDSLRSTAAEAAVEENSLFSGWTIASYVLTGVSAGALIGSAIFNKYAKNAVDAWQRRFDLFNGLLEAGHSPQEAIRMGGQTFRMNGKRVTIGDLTLESDKKIQFYTAASSVSKGLAIGFAVSTVVFSAVSVYLTYQDMKAYYKVEFTPIPHYMVDEKDLVAYNAKGEKVILKNQSAYYKAVETNRGDSDELFSVLGTSNDMNGDVGKQWLTLYAAKNEAEDPILASSLKVVVGDTNLPAGYETGIHTFGSEAAFNLNDAQYVWNKSAVSTFVYFKRDEGKAANNTGSNFTVGTLALTGGAGIALGAAVTALGMKSSKKKRENKAVTA